MLVLLLLTSCQTPPRGDAGLSRNADGRLTLRLRLCSNDHLAAIRVSDPRGTDQVRDGVVLWEIERQEYAETNVPEDLEIGTTLMGFDMSVPFGGALGSEVQVRVETGFSGFHLRTAGSDLAEGMVFRDGMVDWGQAERLTTMAVFEEEARGDG